MNSIFSIRHYYSLFLFAAVLLFAGCGSSVDEAGRHNIRGTVTYDGTPLTTGEVTFSPKETKAPEGAQRAGGIAYIQSDGTYALSRDLGLFEGTYEVRIRSSKQVYKDTKEDVPSNYDPYAANARDVEIVQLIPDKFQTNPQITITVGTDKNQTHDFKLEK